MKDKICIFAGTTEGRRLAELLSGCADVTACTATEYGETALGSVGGITVRTGRMNADEMEEFFASEGFVRIIDATHPYAQIATENIASAAAKAGIPLMRILRGEDGSVKNAVYVSSAREARDYLLDKRGSILITTGAKELSDYTGLDMSRVWARVLPLTDSLEACEKADISAAHIIAAQGPFSRELNLAQLRMINAAYLVTKASGKSGGFEEKISAAAEAGAIPIIIGRPPQTDGLTTDEAVKELQKAYPEISKRTVDIIGVGPGDGEFMTARAKAALDECDAVFGANSVTALINTGKPIFTEYTPEKVKRILDEHPSVRHAAVVMRGDTGFFSGAKRLIGALGGYDIDVIPGISSVSLFAARLRVSWEDAALLSMHGRRCNIVRAVDRSKKTFVLCSNENTPNSVCCMLCKYGLGALTVAVGERLSYPDERITRGTTEELIGKRFDPLSVLYIENPKAKAGAAVGIPDGEFIRGEVPMTKSEIRSVSLSKLSPRSDSVIWDVGAGTGSVSVECALAAYKGQVFAVERDREAIWLIRRNRLKFRADNIEIIEGEAPEALEKLPAPTHVFIGGSGGRLRGIIEAALRRNPDVRIVINTVTLESKAEASACMREYRFAESEVTEINVSRSIKAGDYNLMKALNPVAVFTMQGGCL